MFIYKQSVYANMMPPAFPPSMQIPPHMQHLGQQPPPLPPPPAHQQQQHHQLQPPMYPAQISQTLSAASSVNTNLNMLNQSGLQSDQPNQSMMNNLSFQSERTPFNQNRTLNLNGTIPTSANALNQQTLKQQQQQQQQGNQFTTSASYNDMQQQQQQQQAFKSQPPVSNMNVPAFNPSQPPPALFTASKSANQLPANMTSPTKPATSIGQSQQPIKFAPLQNTTSTPQQANLFGFKQQQPSQQPQTGTAKPPIFQLSPAKPLNDATNLSTKPAAPSVFGGNLFKPAVTTTTTTTPTTVPAPTAANLLFKAPQPTTLLGANQTWVIQID